MNFHYFLSLSSWCDLDLVLAHNDETNISESLEWPIKHVHFRISLNYAKSFTRFTKLQHFMSIVASGIQMG